MIKDDEEDATGAGHSHSHNHPPSLPLPSAPPPQYGTFQGVANYPPPASPSIGFPAPPPPQFYYPTVPGYAVVEGRPFWERRLPCCGLGCGWFLFLIGFFLIAIPWYIGFLILICGHRVDYREKPGLIACSIAAIIATVAMIIEAKERANRW